MKKIYSTWTVVAKNLDNEKVITDKFTASSTAEAIHSFRECYRNADYEILATLPGEDLKKEEKEKKLKRLIQMHKEVLEKEEEINKRKERLYKQWEESEDVAMGAELDLAYGEWKRASESEDGKYRILDIGGVANDNGKQYIIVFHHEDKIEGDCWVIIVGRNTEGFTIEFAKDAATVIDAAFKCKPQDGKGTLIKYVEEKEPTSTITYTQETLEALTVTEIEGIAATRGYTLTGTAKADKITSFLAQQNA